MERIGSIQLPLALRIRRVGFTQIFSRLKLSCRLVLYFQVPKFTYKSRVISVHFERDLRHHAAARSNQNNCITRAYAYESD